MNIILYFTVLTNDYDVPRRRRHNKIIGYCRFYIYTDHYYNLGIRFLTEYFSTSFHFQNFPSSFRQPFLGLLHYILYYILIIIFHASDKKMIPLLFLHNIFQEICTY